MSISKLFLVQPNSEKLFSNFTLPDCLVYFQVAEGLNIILVLSLRDLCIEESSETVLFAKICYVMILLNCDEVSEN